MVHPSRDVIRERKLLRAARRGDRGARDRLVASHLGLVRAVAARYRDLGLPFDDLVQEGSIGLLDAIDRYDPGRQTDFETFARFRVRRAIRNALTDQARLVRLPKQVVARRRTLTRLDAQLTAANGRAPTLAELAAASGFSPRAVTAARTAAITSSSLEGSVASGGFRLDDVIADAASPNPEREALDVERAQLVRGAVAELSPRQRAVVTRHFGLDGSEVKLAALACELHVSERRARTIERDALHELQAALEALVAVR
jgi:RNA polymerase primary sigma factor